MGGKSSSSAILKKAAKKGSENSRKKNRRLWKNKFGDGGGGEGTQKNKYERRKEKIKRKLNNNLTQNILPPPLFIKRETFGLFFKFLLEESCQSSMVETSKKGFKEDKTTKQKCCRSLKFLNIKIKYKKYLRRSHFHSSNDFQEEHLDSYCFP